MVPKILLIGCGAVTQKYHAPVLTELQKRGVLSVVALLDPSRSELGAVHGQFPESRILSSLDEVASAGCDIALVASPARLHAEQTIACFQSGLAVLCEKPMAASVKDAEAMIEAARRHGKALLVGQVRRFYGTTQLLKRIVEENIFGAVRRFSMKEGGNFGWNAKTASFFDKPSAGGGVLLDTGIHTLDLLLWWFGQPDAYSYEDDAMGGVEANCRLTMEYSAFQGKVQLTRDCEIENVCFLEFENAWIRWRPYSADEIEIGFPKLDSGVRGQLFRAELEGHRPTKYEFAPPSLHGFLQEWLNIVSANSGAEPSLVPGTEAIRSLAFIENCYAMRSFMEPPWFTVREKDRARGLIGESKR